MKRFGICTTILAVIMLFSTATAQGQPGKTNEWQEKMRAEKIAFITQELALTPDEAKVFWPVYDQCCLEKQQSHKAMTTAYRNLSKAVKEGTAGDKELDKLLDEYLAAKKVYDGFKQKDAEKYRKVLPGAKVAKLFIAEESFRRHQIRSMKCSQPQHPYGNRPGTGRGTGRGTAGRR